MDLILKDRVLTGCVYLEKRDKTGFWPYSYISWLKWKTEVQGLTKYEVSQGEGRHNWEVCKYTHGLYSVKNNLLEMGVETTTRRHKYKLRCCTSFLLIQSCRLLELIAWLRLLMPHRRSDWGCWCPTDIFKSILLGKTGSFLTEICSPMWWLQCWKLI